MTVARNLVSLKSNFDSL